MKRRLGCIDGAGAGICLEQELPSLARGQVRVKVQASLISPGTELGRVPQLRLAPKPDQPPRPFGYANAGVIDQVGEGVEQFVAGQRVACMGGGYALHADWANVPQNMCVALPDGLSCEQGAFAHLAATALHAIRRTEPLFGENGMVMGLGLVGQLCAQFGQLSGCHMLGVDRYQARLQLAAGLGVEATVDPAKAEPAARALDFSQGFGMDFGIIAFGGDATAAFEQLRASLKLSPDGHRMGRITIVGGATITHGFAAGLGNVDVRSAARTGPGYHDEEYEHGAQYPPVFVPWPTQRNLAECMRALADKKLQVEELITHRFALDQIGQAVDALVEAPHSALGVILEP